MKRGLLSVSFGTSYAATREKTIDAVEKRLMRTFGDRLFYSAWASGRIVAKVAKERGEHHDTLEDAFARIEADGVDDLLVSTMCLMRGYEMEKTVAAARAWQSADANRTVRLARPLLESAEDRREMARIICEEFSSVAAEDALLLMGHGSKDAPTTLDGRAHDANAVYGQIQEELHGLGRSGFFVATVEGTPTFDDALAHLDAFGASRVHLAPFMIVAGDHATNDLAGDEPDSWKSMLSARGFEVEVALKGLGEYDGVQQLVVEHACSACEADALR